MPLPDDLLLGIDVGTQGVKAALINLEGKVLAHVFNPHETIYPHRDWVEHDMQKNWWENAILVIRKLLSASDHLAERIRGIGICGLYPALGPTDEQGNPIYKAILYSDNRAALEVEEVNRKRNLRLSCEELTPKLIWFLRHEPQLAARMTMFFDAPHYLIYKLSGAYVTDTITAGLYGAIFEAPTASWRESVCDMFDIPINILPRAFPPATVVGQVHQTAANLTGLLPGTPVIAGMPDLFGEMISAGVTATDEAILYYGSAGVLPVMKDEALNAAFKPFPISERGGRVQEGYLYDYPVYSLSVGDGVRWFKDQFAQLETLQAAQEPGFNAFARLDQLAESVPAGCDGLVFLPYLLGQRSPVDNPFANGVYFGLRAAHTRDHLYRALLESWGYTVRYGLESMYPQGYHFRRLVATGGGARSRMWRQIVTDICGIPQDHVPDAQGPLGAAYIAGLGVGVFSDFGDLTNKWVKVSASIIRETNQSDAYAKNYEIFKTLHEDLSGAFNKHHELLHSSGEKINV